MEEFTLVIICKAKPEKKHMQAPLAVNLIKAYESLDFDIQSAVILRGKYVEQLNTNPLNRIEK